MEAVNYLTNWTGWLLLIVPAGAACAVASFSARKAMTEDEGVIADCDSNIKKTIKASIIIFSISALVTLFKSYFM